MSDTTVNPEKRWRLILGSPADAIHNELNADELRMDAALSQLYDLDGEGGAAQGRGSGKGSLASSSPNVSRWLGDIRKYFPSTCVEVMQKDAIERLNLRQLLLEPEVLDTVEADIHLVSTLISLKNLIPAQTKETARQVVRKLVNELLKKLEQPTRSAVAGAIARHLRNPRPRFNEIDWPRTIKANLKTYQPDHKTIIPEKLVGYGRKRHSVKEIILCIDQSGSMASSVIYSSIFGAVLASLPSLSLRFVVFDTAVVDLSEQLSDPVDILFGTQLGGGTDIHRALRYCEDHVTRPADTTMVLISDLCEGGNAAGMLKTAARIKESGVNLITLLALSDEGQSYSDQKHAAQFASLDIPVFSCTPDQFPDLMATALTKKDVHLWAHQQGIKVTRKLGAQ